MGGTLRPPRWLCLSKDNSCGLHLEVLEVGGRRED